MTWNHRVIRWDDGSGAVVYRIHEVYYEDDGSIFGWTQEPVAPLGESLEELRAELGQFVAALDAPVLEERTEGEREVLRVVEAE